MKPGRLLPRWQQRLLRVCLGLIIVAVFLALALAPFVLQRNLETADTTALRNELFELHHAIDALERAREGWRAARDTEGTTVERAGLELDERAQLLAHRTGVILAYPGASGVLPENGHSLRHMRERMSILIAQLSGGSAPEAVRSARDRIADLDRGEFVELDRYVTNAFRRLGQITAVERGQLTQLSVFTQRFAMFLLLVGVLTLVVLWLQHRGLRRAELSLQSVIGDLIEAQRIAHIGNVRRDFRHDRVTWSAEFARIYGLDPEGHMTGAEFEALLLPSDAEKVLESERATLAQARETAAPARRDLAFRALRSDGEVIELEVHSEFTADPEGRPVSMVSTVRDITQEARARRALRDSERSLATAQRIARLGSFRHNYKTNKTHWSSELYVLLARPANQGPVSLTRIVHPDDHDRVRQMFIELMTWGPIQGQRQVGFDCRVLAASEERWIRGTAEMTYDMQGQPDMLTGSLQDVTDEIAQERALREALSEAERANTAKSEFLAVMSHELRTPMNGVLGMLSAMEDWTLDESQRRHVEIARTSGEALLLILNDVLDMTKIEAGRMDLDQRPFALRPLIDSVVNLYAESARTRDTTLQATIDPLLPKWVSADPLRIRQILANIVSNAVKFTQKGSIELALMPAPHMVAPEGMVALRFAVSDTGIGIPLDKHDYVFGRFNQLDSSFTRRFGGTGLGLAICRSLAELMGGRMGFASKPGKGSSFWFDLMVPVAEAEEVPAEPKALPPLPAMTILVAEDNATNQIVARSMLERLGQRAEFVADGSEAVRAVAGKHFDLVLMDISMPVLDGIEATRQIRQMGGRHAMLPILALTAHAGQSEHRDCLEAGCNEVLTKPLNCAVLQAALQRWSGGQMPKTGPGPEPEAGGAGRSMAARLSDLGEQIGIEAMPDLIKASLGDLSHHRGLIAAAVSGETVAPDVLRRACHSIVGIASAFGAIELADLARAAERDLKLSDAPLADPEALLAGTRLLEELLREQAVLLHQNDPVHSAGTKEPT